MDLVARYCQGEDEQFAGVPCIGYDRKTGECAYLRTGCLGKVFEQARCPAISKKPFPTGSMKF